jgi:uncharacterized membrane protein
MGVYGHLVFGAAIIAGLSLITYGVLRQARVIRTPGSGSVHHDLPHQVAFFLVATEFFLATCMSAAALLPLTGNPGIAAVVVPTVLLLAVIFPLAHWLNKSRAPFASESTHVLAGDGTFDEHWRLGMFYFNPNDPALFIERRIGIGYTVNFGRGWSWLILFLVLALPLSFVLATLGHR